MFHLKAQVKIVCPPLKTPYQSMNFMRNDTVFIIYCYPSKENFDSAVCKIFATKYTKNNWITDTSLYGSYAIIKFKKAIPSRWFKENNGKLFQANYEYIIRRCWRYYPDDSMDIYWRFGYINHFKKVNATNKTKIARVKKHLQISP